MDAATETRPQIFLLPGRDKRLGRGHPWVYSNEVKIDADAKAVPPGTVVTLHRVDGKRLGVASFNPHALICARLYDLDYKLEIDREFFISRLWRALNMREKFYDAPFYRLAHADADGLPGIVIDRLGDTVVCQLNTAGADLMTEPLLEALDEVIKPACVILRGDRRSRQQEGLEPFQRIAKGTATGPVEGLEDKLRFLADVQDGQKTGWFFDQRDNRLFLAGLVEDANVLDVFCYEGGFALQAALAGARRTMGIDSSQAALDLAAENAKLNGLEEKCSWRRFEAFAALEEYASADRTFDVVVADPPAFAKSKGNLKAGLRGYRKLARMAAAVVKPGGFLMLCSCSHHVDPAAFAAENAAGLNAAGRTGRILRSAGAGPDHPVHPNLPESAYLKSILYQLD